MPMPPAVFSSDLGASWLVGDLPPGLPAQSLGSELHATPELAVPLKGCVQWPPRIDAHKAQLGKPGQVQVQGGKQQRRQVPPPPEGRDRQLQPRSVQVQHGQLNLIRGPFLPVYQQMTDIEVPMRQTDFMQAANEVRHRHD